MRRGPVRGGERRVRGRKRARGRDVVFQTQLHVWEVVLVCVIVVGLHD